MKAIALSIASLLFTAQTPTDKYDSLEPVTVKVTFADADWVDTECRKRVGPERSPPRIEACAGVGGDWIIMRHGALYPGERCGYVVGHEVRHIRGWYHG